MGYRDLLDLNYTFEIDTSNLETKLEEITEKLDGFESVDEDRVQEIVRDMMHSEGEDFVQGIISNEGYITEDDVDSKLGDYPDESRVQSMLDGALDEYVLDSDLASAVRDVLSDEGLDSNSVADAEDVDTLKRDLADLIKQVENLTGRVVEAEERNATALTFFDLIKQAFALIQRN